MRRFLGVLLIGLLLIGILGVQAQDCNWGVSDDDCELLNEAFRNLADAGDLYFNFQLSIQMTYGASEFRSLFISGAGALERDNDGNIESFESGAVVSGGTNNFYELGRTNYINLLSFYFEEDEFAFGNDEDSTLVELNAEILPMTSLFPFFQTEIVGDVVVTDVELSQGEQRHFFFPVEHGLTESPFAYVQNLVFGQELEELSGESIFDVSIMIDVEEETLSGTIYRVTDYIDGELLGYDRPIRRETYYILRFTSQDYSTFDEFSIDDEIEDEDGIYGAAVQNGPITMLFVGLSEDMSEHFPPMGQSIGLGGISLDEMMGGNEPTAEASNTPTTTPTPTAINTPIATAVGYPCSATIAGDEGEVLRVIHRDPTEESTIIRAARAGEEFTVINRIENDEGVWYQLRFGGADGYVLEENLVLGEDCP